MRTYPGTILLIDGPCKGRTFGVPLLSCGYPSTDWSVQDGHSIYQYAWDRTRSRDGAFHYTVTGYPSFDSLGRAVPFWLSSQR